MAVVYWGGLAAIFLARRPAVAPVIQSAVEVVPPEGADAPPPHARQMPLSGYWMPLGPSWAPHSRPQVLGLARGTYPAMLVGRAAR